MSNNNEIYKQGLLSVGVIAGAITVGNLIYKNVNKKKKYISYTKEDVEEYMREMINEKEVLVDSQINTQDIKINENHFLNNK